VERLPSFSNPLTGAQLWRTSSYDCCIALSSYVLCAQDEPSTDEQSSSAGRVATRDGP
jgi:hypothetical protein